MEVFVVLGSLSYEGSTLLGVRTFESSTLLGVYHTLEDARAAVDVYRSEVGDDYDGYSVQRRVIGARADWRNSDAYVELL